MPGDLFPFDPLLPAPAATAVTASPSGPPSGPETSEAAAAPEPLVFEFPAARRAEALERLAKLAKTAAKLGVPSPTWKIGEPYPFTFTETVKGGRDVTRTVIKCRMTVDVAPVILPGNWKLLGTIHPTTEGNILGNVPGCQIPESYRTADGTHCDHCHTTRRRAETHVVERTLDGALRQVGSSCIKDFLGGHSAEQLQMLLNWAKVLRDATRELGGFGDGGQDVPSMQEILKLSAYFIRTVGWVSGGEAKVDDRKTATSSQVAWFRHPGSSLEARAAMDRWLATYGPPTDADEQTAEAALQWARNTFAGPEHNPDSDYLANLGVLVRLGYVESQFQGLAVSLVSAHHRALDRLHKAEAAKRSTFVGQEKQRGDFSDLRVRGMHAIETQFGTTTRVEMVDPQGNLLVWWASRAPGLSIGDVIDARATVKKHEEYKGVKQTVVTRLDAWPGKSKAVDPLAAAAAADQAVAADAPSPGFAPAR